MKRSNRSTINIDAVLAMAALALSWATTVAADQFPATGQTSCWDSSGTPIDCAGTGQDGDIPAAQ